jgi:hypothetical protein
MSENRSQGKEKRSACFGVAFDGGFTSLKSKESQKFENSTLQHVELNIIVKRIKLRRKLENMLLNSLSGCYDCRCQGFKLSVVRDNFWMGKVTSVWWLPLDKKLE